MHALFGGQTQIRDLCVGAVRGCVEGPGACWGIWGGLRRSSLPDTPPCSLQGEGGWPSMLFHNRPVKAAMGSVIVNGGVQLSGGKSLVNTKLVTLHFGLAQPG